MPTWRQYYDVAPCIGLLFRKIRGAATDFLRGLAGPCE